MPSKLASYLNKTILVAIPALFDDGVCRPFTLLGAELHGLWLQSDELTQRLLPADKRELGATAAAAGCLCRSRRSPACWSRIARLRASSRKARSRAPPRATGCGPSLRQVTQPRRRRNRHALHERGRNSRARTGPTEGKPMSSLIVIRIVPPAATDPVSFSSVLASLTIDAFDLSFTSVDAQPPGQSVGAASFIAASGLTGVSGHPDRSSSAPTYPPGVANGIVQQFDFVPAVVLPPSPAYYQLEAVGVAVLEIASPSTFENLRLAVQSGGQTVPVAVDYYDAPLAAGPTPDPSTWAGLAPSLYLQLPASLPSSGAPALQLPSDGTPPAFQELLQAMLTVLKDDPGASVVASTSAAAAAGGAALQFPAGTTGVGPGMTVSGAAGIPAGTSVTTSISAAGGVLLNQQLSAAVNGGTAITFTPDLAALTLDQCQNIAYEIVWSQQPPPPTPPDPVEDLYTNPPNTGALLGGSNNTTPNQYEGDRQQFEAQLNSYYTVANATADRLTNFVFALSAAIACQQLSLAATDALIELPPDPGTGSVNDVAVILTGLGPAGAATNFGVPAAYFYALAAAMPPQVTVAQRFSLATRDALTDLLADLTTAIGTGIVTDSESFAAPLLGGTAPAGSVNAAQAARRFVALNVPASAATALAPLDSLALATGADAASGTTLTFAALGDVNAGMSAAGPNIPPGATVSGVTAASGSVTLSGPVLNDVPAGTEIVFTPPYSPGLDSLIQSWLSFPTTPTGAISSVSYQPGDDDSQVLAGCRSREPAAFLNLVLCALTQGAMLPAPFTGALGDAIVASATLGSPTTVAALAAVTAQQWTQFFQANPTWLPSFTLPGDTTARIAAFIRAVQKLFAVGSGGPSSPFVLATSAATASGAVLHFPPTKAIAKGMSVSGPTTIPTGATVTGVATTAAGVESR